MASLFIDCVISMVNISVHFSFNEIRVIIFNFTFTNVKWNMCSLVIGMLYFT